MSYGTVQAEKVTTESGYSLGAGNASSFKNRFINPGMVIDQRNNGSVVAGAAGNIYGVDRFNTGVFGSGTGRISAQRSSDAPSGFINSLLNTVTTTDTSPSTYYGYCVQQKIEGLNVADLGFGAAGAKTVTLSFWVKSSVAGTYVVTLMNETTSQAYAASYTVDATGTWEQKIVTFTGSTTGTWPKDNTTGMIVTWGLGGGSGRIATTGSWYAPSGGYTPTAISGGANWIGTSSATFQLTGCQLEVGTVATSFDFRSIGTELILCYRYYQSIGANSQDVGAGTAPMRLLFANNGGTQPLGGYPFPFTMRASPTLTVYGGSIAGGSWNMNSNIAATTTQVGFAGTDIGPKGIRINATSSTSGGNSQYWADVGTGSGQLGMTFSAEL